MKSLLIISTVFILLSSCSDESSYFDPTYFGEGFNGITFTGETGPEQLGGDLTDWCYSGKSNLYKISNTQGIGNEDPIFPTYFSFLPAYPNPITINESTIIRYSLPEATKVYIYVINNQHQTVAVLVNSLLQAGTYEVEMSTKKLSGAGVYRVIFESDKFKCKGDVWVKGK